MSEPRPGSTPPSGSSRSLVTVLGIVVVVLLVVIVAVIGYLVFGRSADSGFPTVQSSSNAPVSTATTTLDQSTSTPTPTTPSRTPVPRTTDAPTTDDEGPTLAGAPDGSTPCPIRYGRTGLYRASAAGSSATSCGFAEEVRMAYAESGRPGQLPRTISAVSPENGLRYRMSCAAQRSIVTCTGGNDAVVYLYR